VRVVAELHCCSSDRLLRSDRIAVPGMLRPLPPRPHTFRTGVSSGPPRLGSLAGSELDAGSHEIAFFLPLIEGTEMSLTSLHDLK
jgi:hypothetical protein